MRSISPLPITGRRLLVVSHPAVVDVNQEVYRELARRGWDLTVVLPSRWRHEYAHTDVTPRALPGLEDSLRPTPVAFPGRPQRHFYLTSCRSICARSRPHVAFVEAEPYSLSAAQWSRAFRRLGIPFGVQCYENIDRPLPMPVRRLRSRVLREAAFVAARSDSAARLARAWGARGEVDLAPPAVPAWDTVAVPDRDRAPGLAARPLGERPPAERPLPERPLAGRPLAERPLADPTEHPQAEHSLPEHPQAERPFTVGYAGRLIESKGLIDLLAAVRQLDAPVELVLIGNGELRAQLDGQPIPGSRVRVLDTLTHDQMARGYAQLDVLVLPSHTTPTWKEQFGRVIVEALWCGVPVVGSDSGEIPWLIGLTGGGLVFPEGDRDALAAALGRLREAPELRRELAASGRAAVEERFSVPAATDSLERLLVRAAEKR